MQKQPPIRVFITRSFTFIVLLLAVTLTLGLLVKGTSAPTAVEAATHTAGVTTVGPVMDSGNNNGISTTQVTTSSTGGTLDNIKVRVGNVNSAPKNHMRVAIYADNGSNLPGARLGVSNSQVLTANSWNTFPLTSSVTIAANTKYWLAFNVDGANTQYALERNVTGARSGWKIPTTYGTWPHPMGTLTHPVAAEQYSIYMTYTSVDPTATPTPTNTPSPTPTPTPGGSQTYTAGYQVWNGTFDSGNNNLISATQITTGQNGGTSQSISIYMGSVTAAPNNHIQVGIYSDNGANNPGTLLGSSASQVITPNSWNTIALPSVTITPNTKYFLAFNLDGGTTQFGWNSTTTGISRWKFNTTFGTWPASFGTPSLSESKQYAIYLTYANGTPTRELFGMGLGEIPYVSATDRAIFLNDNKAMGVQWGRFDINWSDIQSGGPTSWNWTNYDAAVDDTVAKGIKVLGILDYSPTWARSSYCASSQNCAPTNINDYVTFVQAAVTRYAPKGVHYWEIWNEPNLGAFTAAYYTEMMQAAYTAIKEIDPQAFVLAGGSGATFTQGTLISHEDFLTGMYQNGGKNYFDALTHHPYCYDPNFDCPTAVADWSSWSRMSQTSNNLRSIMIANGDEAKKIWATEFGAPTAGGARAITEAQQAQMVIDAYTLWASYSWADGPLFWYNYRNQCTSTTDLECNFGLARYDLSHKPAYDTYKNLATGQ